MKWLFCFGCLIHITSYVMAEAIAVPDDSGSIETALAKAHPGDTILLSKGTYTGNWVVGDGVTIVGKSAEHCTLQGSPDQPTVTVSGNVRLQGLSVTGGRSGILVSRNASLTVEACHILDNQEDGIGFENDFNTVISINNCLIKGNGDGVDLESTQAVIRHSLFSENRDDGLDLDGEAGALIYDCNFSDNGDDGIEIRIATKTHCILQSSRFSGNGEDGVEIINSPTQGKYNLLCVQNCTFEKNVRFGVGFVTHGDEIATEEKSLVALYATGNAFIESGEGTVSDNYRDVFEAEQGYPKRVRVQISGGERSTEQTLPVKMPILVGVYNLHPTTDGTMVSDAEGVTVSKRDLFVADDNNKAVYILDRLTAKVMKILQTHPFPGQDHVAMGPEGLDLTEVERKEALLLSDDDGKSIYTISLEEETFGRVLRRQDTGAIGPVEGAEQIKGRLILAANRSSLYATNPDNLEPLSPPLDLSFDGFGSHIAGVGSDDLDERVFVTLSGYDGISQKWRNHRSAYFEMDGDLRAVKQFRHLGPFSNDPRGIAVSDGLVYVVDGRSDFVDERTGETNRGGIKVFVFLPDETRDALSLALPYLPFRTE